MATFSLAAALDFTRLGMEKAAMMPITATTISNSIREKPGLWQRQNEGIVTVYNSRISNASNSIKDCDNGSETCNAATAAYGNPTDFYRIGIQINNSLDWIGQIGEVTTWSDELSETEVCQICRCGPANQQFQTIVGNLNTTGDRYDECNKCTLPTVSSNPVTHCGPRRIM